jgi:hypothetical protein
MFEVVLVMAVLVVAASITIPAILPMLTSNHLQAASDMVRSHWTEMKTRAISDGRSYRFSIIENTGKFRIAPEDEADDHGERRPWVLEGTLPGNVLFTGSHAIGDSKSQAAAGGGWTRVVTILANGTSHEDVQVSFGQSGSRPLVLRLRGATGAITAEEAKL